MATLGMTKLMLVQHLTLAVDGGRVPALDPGGASMASDAEFIIDEVIDDLIAAGAHDSIKYCNQSLTADGSGIITVPNTTIRVFGTGLYKKRGFSLAGDAIFDDNEGKSTGLFAPGAVVVFDLWKRPANPPSANNYDLLDPAMKAMVAKESKVRWMALKRPDAARDAMLIRERNQVYGTQIPTIENVRTSPQIMTNPINIPPLVQVSRTP